MVARQLLRAAAIALLAASSVFGQVVTVSDWGPAVTEPFDPAHPPADLADGEAADATPFVEVAGAAHSGAWDGVEYVVKKVDPVTSGGIPGFVFQPMPTPRSRATRPATTP